MSCITTNFKRKYDIEDSGDVVSLVDLPAQKAAEMKHYVKQANAEAQQEGFLHPLFEIKFGEGKIEEGKDIHPDNYIPNEFIQINRKNIEDFQEYSVNNSIYEDILKKESAKYDYLDDSDLETRIPKEDKLLLYDEDSEFLFSFSPMDDSEIERNPETFYEWRESLKKVREKLEHLADRYTKLKDTKSLKEVYKTLDQINENIHSIDSTDPNSIYESSMKEIEILESFLRHIQEHPEEGVTALDGNQLIDRINNLQRYFLGVNPDTGERFNFKKLDEGHPIGEFYFSFSEGLDEKKVDEVVQKVQDLRDLYKRAQVKVVQGILLNDGLVVGLQQQHSVNPEEGWSAEDVQRALEIIATGDVEVDELGKLFLGIASGGGILGQLLKNKRDNQLSRERGQTQKRVGALKNVWDTIKNTSDMNDEGVDEFITSRLIKKDKFGKRTSELISLYTDLFKQKVGEVYAERRQFENTLSQVDYQSYMDADKRNFHRINPLLLSAVAEKYGNTKEHGKFFTYSEEEIAEYERGLKGMLGETMFEIEVQKAISLVEDFMLSSKDSSLTVQQEYRRNPFRFMKHYHSDNYAQADSASLEFLTPHFVHYVPRNNPNFYNQDFKAVEEGSYGKELMEFYKNAHSLLTDYINPIFRSEGVGRSALSFLTFEDMTERESMKQKNLFGRISATLGAIWQDYKSSYISSDINKQKRIIQEQKEGNFEKELQTGYTGFGYSEFRKNEELYKNLSDSELYKLAEEKGYEVKDFPPPANTEGYKRFRKELIESIAREEINRVTSSNLYESIKNAAAITNDISARRASVATLEALKSYVYSLREDPEFGGQTPRNISEMLSTWGDINIYGYKFTRDINSKGLSNLLGETSRTSIPLTKVLTSAEKRIKKFINEEKKRNNNGKDYFEFEFKNVKYTTTKEGIFKATSEDGVETIPLSQISQRYNDYLNEKLDELGTQVTVGSAGLGLMASIISKHLGLSPRGGIRNRLQGVIQTAAVAASGRYSFNEVQYHNSRRLLRGTNTRKYFFSESFKNSERGQKIRTVQLFQEAMQLKQNRADELALDGKFDKLGGTFLDKAKTFYMDFSINNPEWHNQTEIMTSVLQTVKVRDVNGVEHPFFNGKTQEFIYKPGTLDLRDGTVTKIENGKEVTVTDPNEPNFDTLENRQMWVEFRETDSGKVDSLVAVAKVKTAIHQTQGNYDNNDIILAQNSVAGKLGTMYQRYLFENTNMQWGKHKVDLRTGEFDIKGRRLSLFEHGPTTAMFLTGMHGIPIIAGIFMGMNPAFLLGTGLFAIGTRIAFAKKLRSMKRKATWTRQDLALSIDFAKEAALRSINMPLQFWSYGKVNLMTEERLAKFQQGRDLGKRNLTAKERKILSESAQDVASKAFIYANAAIGFSILRLVVKLLDLSFGWDEDDEEDEKSLFRKAVEYVFNTEDYINTVINDVNTLTGETEKFTNPSVFLDEVFSQSFARTLDRGGKFVARTARDVSAGEFDADGEFYYKLLSNTPFLPVSNHMLKSVLSEDKGVFKDNMVYDGSTPMDRMIFRNNREGEKNAKAELRSRRKQIRTGHYGFDRVMNRRVRRDFPNMSKEQRKKKVDQLYRQYFKSTYKKPGRTYRETLENVNWKQLETYYRDDLFMNTRRKIDDILFGSD